MIPQVFPLKISVEERVHDVLDRFSVEAAVRFLCKAICARCLKEISTKKISLRDLKVRSLVKRSKGDL